MTATQKPSTKKGATKARTSATRGRTEERGTSAPKKEQKGPMVHSASVTAEQYAARKKRNLLDAAIAVMKAGKQPMRAQEIIRAVLEQALWQTTGKTPAATLYSALIREISNKGDKARFKKVGRGQFVLSDKN